MSEKISLDSSGYLYNILKVAGCFLRLHTRNKLKAYLKLFLHENTFAARISLYLQKTI